MANDGKDSAGAALVNGGLILFLGGWVSLLLLTFQNELTVDLTNLGFLAAAILTIVGFFSILLGVAFRKTALNRNR